MATRVSLGPRRNVSVSSAGLVTGGAVVRPSVRRSASVYAHIAATVPVASGDGFTSNGTLSAPTPALAGLRHPVLDAASGAVLNNTGILHGQQAHLWGNRLQWEGYVVPAVGALSSLALARWWAGLFSAALSSVLPLDTPHTSSLSAAGFRFSTSASDGTTWRAVTSNGTATTVTDTGVTITAGTAYRMSVVDDGTATVFGINGAVVATHDTNRPADATLMRQGCGVITLEAAAKSCAMGWMFLQYNE
jgi:hypothetical protein